MVGLSEIQWDDEIALEIHIAQFSVALYEGQAVVVDIFIALGRIVVVLDGEDHSSQGVDDSVMVLQAGQRAAHLEGSYLIVDAGDDFAPFKVQKTLLAVADDTHPVVLWGRDGKVVGFRLPFRLLATQGEECHSIVVAGEKDSLFGERDLFITVRQDQVAEGVDKAPAFVAFHRGVAVGEGHRHVVERFEEDVSEGVEIGRSEEEGIDGDGDGSAIAAERIGMREDGGDDEVATEVGESVAAVLDNEGTSTGGEFGIVVEAGDNDFALRGEDAAERVFQPDAAVAVLELAYMKVDIGREEAPVVAFESVAVALAGGLDAVDKKNVAAASRVGLVARALCRDSYWPYKLNNQ